MIPALRLSKIEKAALTCNGVLTSFSVLYLLPSSRVAVAVEKIGLTLAEISMVLSINPIPAGLKIMLSEPNFWATPV